ncbi:hypothetical protein SUNI508_10873 [Seiridium unicorne]|uniref:Uncharacterized protein n=1 Tax=Seiridium unicorne TaxID=138068 RepID=A0ABR2UJF1_9PEZI
MPRTSATNMWKFIARFISSNNIQPQVRPGLFNQLHNLPHIDSALTIHQRLDAVRFIQSNIEKQLSEIQGPCIPSTAPYRSLQLLYLAEAILVQVQRACRTVMYGTVPLDRIDEVTDVMEGWRELEARHDELLFQVESRLV